MNYLLKKSLGLGLSLLLLLGSAGAAAAQNTRNLKERRIFLWDVTISMVGATKKSPNRVPATPRTNPSFDYAGWQYDSERDIFDKTRQELLNMIDNIQDEECEIIVVPYTEDIQEPFWVSSASVADKAQIKKLVLGWNNLKPGGTNTGLALNKVITNYFAKDRINRVVLLTDGRPDDGEDLYRILMDWDQTKVGTRYHNSRLVYVMLTDQAVDERALDILSGEGDKGKDVIKPGEAISERLSFVLSDNLISIHVAEYAKDGYLENGGNLVVGCAHQTGPESRLSEVRCRFICEENPLISVSSATVKLDESGKFVIPFTFKGNDREYYLNELSASGLTGRVALKCEIDPSCKDIVLEGSDEITVEVIVKPEPRAIISLTKK